MAVIVRYLRGIEPKQTDADLLGRFIDRRDEAAFALLVRRHGPMVYGVCRRMLAEKDAEDAFQATFLVLVEKAREIAPREAVGNWLYGVARRAALLSRRAIARRRERVGEMPERPAPDPLNELRLVLDEELSRLPDTYRTVIVLCDLEGRTRRETAALLGWAEGTVAGRLVRAREMLAKRLARHAPAVSVVAVLAATASAHVPDAVLASAELGTRVVPATVAAAVTRPMTRDQKLGLAGAGSCGSGSGIGVGWLVLTSRPRSSGLVMISMMASLTACLDPSLTASVTASGKASPRASMIRSIRSS